MDFLNQREGVMVFFISFFSFLPYRVQSRNCKRLREFEEIEISRQAVEVTLNSKGENS
jgi:hypothetical protein